MLSKNHLSHAVQDIRGPVTAISYQYQISFRQLIKLFWNCKKTQVPPGQRSVRYIHLKSATLMIQRTIECNYPHVFVCTFGILMLHIVRPPVSLLRTVPRDIEAIKRTQGEQIGCNTTTTTTTMQIGVPRCLCLRRPTCSYPPYVGVQITLSSPLEVPQTVQQRRPNCKAAAHSLDTVTLLEPCYHFRVEFQPAAKLLRATSFIKPEQ